MVESLFTSKRAPAKEASLNKEMQQALAEIRSLHPTQIIQPIQWDEHSIAIPFEIVVNRPSRGTVNNVDIREREPIFLLIDKRYYPYKAPSAWSNRSDFPKDCLPHLNPKCPGSPANFCLHRGSIDTWFSEHSLADYIQRVEDWLSDAASNRLIKDDGFEETRIDEFIGINIFERTHITNKVSNEWKIRGGKAGFCYLHYLLLNNPENDPIVNKRAEYAIRLENIVSNGSIATELNHAKKINLQFIEGIKANRHFFGILAWPAKNAVYSKYFAELPDTLDGLIKLSEILGIPLYDALKSYISKHLQIFGGIPITIAIPRPQKMVKSDSNIEILNFIVSFGIAADNHLREKGSLNERVMYLAHRYPLTLPRAREISSISSNTEIGKILWLGCGAIGSKFALHLIKSGQCEKITFVDNDELSPHNLIRHALLNEYLGMNKAQALKQVIEEIFYADKNSISATAIQGNALDLILNKDNRILCQHTLLVDATASPIIRNALVNCKNLPSSLSICRTEIADNGKLGIMSIEGQKRNPRLDDILFYLFDLAIVNPEISNWLKTTEKQRDAGINSTLEEINIGISCNSETMRLSDDIISLHSSSFSLGLRKFMNGMKKDETGFLQISTIDNDYGRHTVQTYKIPPVIRLTCENDSRWEVRVKAEIQHSILKCVCDAGHNETGGVLFGEIDNKNKLVYVTRFLPAPPDSISEPNQFIRGTAGVSDKIFEIQNCTGGLIKYIGEWHSHPNGVKRMSIIDRREVKKIKKIFDPVPHSTFMMIATKDEIYPYIFDSDGGKQ